ncbi:hypothetical protein AB0K15_17335 [Amycolatopsis sp. NPDC049253]|uniref:hypothetical protein n=1 Tax=Amycolatopsis sp. NPDC049253 TaxID=3155274 RepID=UPI0034265C75
MDADQPDRPGGSDLEDAVAAALRAGRHRARHPLAPSGRFGHETSPAGPPPAASLSDTPGHLAPGHVNYSLSVSRAGAQQGQAAADVDGLWRRRSQVGSGAPTTDSRKCLSLNASASVEPWTLAPGWTRR